MSEMPGRPVQRDVEAASLRAFEALLPLDWEPHPRRVDFGIDVDVEIFSGGQATGLMFGVQVKGTQRLRSQPSVQIRWTTWNYWRSQSDPVLVVLWDVETERLFWEWSHRFDTSQLERKDAESFTLTFAEDQVWNQQTPDHLRREVEAWRAWSTPYVHLPIAVSVRGVESVAGVPAKRFVAALRGLIRPHGDLFTLGPLGSSSVLSISVDIEPARSVVWLSGGPSATLHYESVAVIESDSEADGLVRLIASDIVLLISGQLCSLNAFGPAARIAGSAVDSSSIVHHPEVAVPMLQLFLEENRIDDGLRLLRRLLLNEDSLPGVLALLSINSVRSLDSAIARRIAVALRDMAWFQARTRGGGAELAYNGAQVMRSFDQRVAIELLDEASRLDPSYRERAYWWRERGGCLFLIQQYKEAAEHYQRALDRGDTQSLPLLADALMFCGEYRRALDLFRQATADHELSRPEWRLKSNVLERLIDLTSVERQKRDPSSARARVSDDSTAQDLKAALEFDLLCPDVLRGLGVVAEANDARSVDFFVAEALVDPLHAHAWLRAIRGAVLEEPSILEDVGSCARRFCGQTVLEVLETEGVQTEIVEFVESLFAEVPPDPAAPVLVRVVQRGSSNYIAIDMNAADEDDPDREVQ